MRPLRLRAFLVILFAGIVSMAEVRNDPAREYIAKYADIAVSEMYRSGVPASITLAQGLLESANGKSELAVKGNNHFGIKCHDWKGKKIYYDDDRKGECFRKYDNPEQSFKDHSDFLRYRDRYKFLFDLKTTDYKGWSYGLKKAGYATDPAYPAKLIRLIETYDLTRFDTGNYVSSDSETDRLKDRRDRKERREQEKAQRKQQNRKDKEERKQEQDNVQDDIVNAIPDPPSLLEQPVPLEDGISFRFPLSRQLYSQNKVPFVYSVEGETYASIASDYNLFLKEILRFNDAEADTELIPGTVVYLQAKKNKAAKFVDKHITDGEESLREIAQRYGVKLKSILKMNGLENVSSNPASFVPGEEDTIILR